MKDGKTEAILGLVRMIPPGQVASYGQIAGYLPGVTARLVGFALAGSGRRGDVPWQRVVNGAGGISGHAGGAEQRRRLEEEGVEFGSSGRVDRKKFGWRGPDAASLVAMGLDPEVALMLAQPG